MALNVFFKSNTNIVDKAFMAFGGLAPVTKIASETCEILAGK